MKVNQRIRDWVTRCSDRRIFQYLTMPLCLIQEVISLLKVLQKYQVKNCKGKMTPSNIRSSETGSDICWEVTEMCSLPLCLILMSPSETILQIRMKLSTDSSRISEPNFFETSPMKGNGKTAFQYQYMSPERTIQIWEILCGKVKYPYIFIKNCLNSNMNTKRNKVEKKVLDSIFKKVMQKTQIWIILLSPIFYHLHYSS